MTVKIKVTSAFSSLFWLIVQEFDFLVSNSTNFFRGSLYSAPFSHCTSHYKPGRPMLGQATNKDFATHLRKQTAYEERIHIDRLGPLVYYQCMWATSFFWINGALKMVMLLSYLYI